MLDGKQHVAAYVSGGLFMFVLNSGRDLPVALRGICAAECLRRRSCSNWRSRPSRFMRIAILRAQPERAGRSTQYGRGGRLIEPRLSLA